MRDGPTPEGTRGRILVAALTEIRQIGLARMRISGIAARLGMSHANVYRYFSDKAAIVDAILNDWLRSLEMRLQDIVEGPDPADDKLERFLATLTRGYAETFRQDPALFRLLASVAANGAEAQRHRRRVESLVERIVEEGIVTRLFQGGDSRRLGTLVLDLTHRFRDPAAVQEASGEEGAGDSRRDRVIRAAIRAISARK
ncbi:MAG TPA: TetR family transcriptional regulator [Rhabdaerophilum sp.]|nr:TetR family transcriptional regulator [Rhabdaerophilum sp.]